MKKPRVIDANIILRFLTNDEPSQAADCAELLQKVELNKEEVYIPDLVIADIVWTLEKYYLVDKVNIMELLGRILALQGLKCSSKSTVYTALDIYCEQNIDWTDAFVGAQMLSAGQQEIYSYDRDFDRIRSLTRLKPQDA